MAGAILSGAAKFVDLLWQKCETTNDTLPEEHRDVCRRLEALGVGPLTSLRDSLRASKDKDTPLSPEQRASLELLDLPLVLLLLLEWRRWTENPSSIESTGVPLTLEIREEVSPIAVKTIGRPGPTYAPGVQDEAAAKLSKLSTKLDELQPGFTVLRANDNELPGEVDNIFELLKLSMSRCMDFCKSIPNVIDAHQRASR
ncbi:hypothetical protein GGR53DRAFT_469046 [Hypoxylon sp. FL1150]|nr:hypothetical protein GGR53DRAFT_469046 [Hypoxylon sp. FL1150]